MASTTLGIWNRLSTKPGGKWLFSKIVCFRAPYFGTVKPMFSELRPGYCEIRARKRRRVLNHIGTVHAIAMCNMAELAAGVMTDVTIPATHRWIPKGMTVEYLKKAETDLVAVATPSAAPDPDAAGDYEVIVDVRDTRDNRVITARINMWLSPKK